MRYLILITICVFSFSNHLLVAQSRIPLSEYLQSEVSSVNNALLDSENSFRPENDREARLWHFRRIWMRLRPNVTFTVVIAKIGIVSELELLWEQPLPAGWTPYKP